MDEISRDDSVHKGYARVVDGVDESLKHVHVVRKRQTEKWCYRVRRRITGLRQRTRVESYRVYVDKRGSEMIGQTDGALGICAVQND